VIEPDATPFPLAPNGGLGLPAAPGRLRRVLPRAHGGTRARTMSVGGHASTLAGRDGMVRLFEASNPSPSAFEVQTW
jgi:hypothetical protein